MTCERESATWACALTCALVLGERAAAYMRATVHRALDAQKAALAHVRHRRDGEADDCERKSRAERPSIAFVDEAPVQPDGETARARSPQVRSSGPSMARVQLQARNPRRAEARRSQGRL